MSEAGRIIRIAARGDGVTGDGRHVAGVAPGDILRADGTIEHGPHHAAPPCRHFGSCGGCQLQQLDEDALRDFVTSRVVNAAEGQGIAVGELLATHVSPPRSRRRATLHALRTRQGAVIGFREAASHRIIDMAECHILHPELARQLPALRQFLARYGALKGGMDIELTLTDQGVACMIGNLALEGLEATEGALEFAQASGLARLAIDQGYGGEALWEPAPVTVTLSGCSVAFPTGGFLQATEDGEQILVSDAVDWLQDCPTIADLFAGLGTFAFAFAKNSRVLAAEAARDAHLACKSAAAGANLPVHALHRDLFRNPLQPDELDKFDGVLIDPPRAGARDQIAQIAASKLDRVVYVSCNPASWARDARVLIDAGFALAKLRPVGQFRWSTHVELASLFVR
ncbi:MAG: RNA methyltransferase [Sphingomonadales bacterium BRH_c42]|nr:MAG: RNA methyltransferase [Sphingomonadales bacterium BRH_c42]